MDLELESKVAVVTGASKGIGLAIARELAGEGVAVVAGSKSVGGLSGIPHVSHFAVDLADAQGPGELVRHAIEQHGRLDILVNNVGAAHVRVGGFLEITDRDFEDSLRLNFFAALRATRAAVPRMIEQGQGTVINVVSVNSFFEPDGAVIDYGAAKAALLNVAKSLSQELGPRGIRVTSVSPGQVATDLWLGEQGVAETVGRAHRCQRRGRSRTGCSGYSHRPLLDAARSGDARRDARVAADGERQRLQLGDRRRPDQDDLSRAAGIALGVR
jgi:NAD(P)-dependent dehydrogenase (short-subunit alcohol dehydrogenase family)